MLIQLMISMFGIAFVHRNLSLLEKIDVLSRSKLNSAFYFLQLPFYFYLIFKELLPVILIYIGVILGTLILFDKIIRFLREKTFERMHLHLIERLILLLKSGKSPQTCVKNVLENLSSWEKVTFSGVNEIFEIKSGGFAETSEKREFEQLYFHELTAILRSTSNVSDQLIAFRRGLRLYDNLKRRAAQAIQATKAQAAVAGIIYLVFFVVSVKYLELKILSIPVFVSLAMFFAGQVMIFKLGGTIRWKT